MIDLIDECAYELNAKKNKIKKYKKYSISTINFFIENSDSKKSGFGAGEYFIINSPLTHLLDKECHDYVCEILRIRLGKMMKEKGFKRGRKVLIVGLGNPAILADALGSKVVDKVEINVDLDKNNIFKISPNVFALTGINSFDMVHMLTIWLDVDFVLLIDSLATKNVNRLGVSIQLNNFGITPGSALNNFGRKICKESLGVPCFAIGVPLMLIGEEVIEDSPENLILTPKDIHENLDNLVYIISKAINLII